jgi:Uma2 family endonuclease
MNAARASYWLIKSITVNKNLSSIPTMLTTRGITDEELMQLSSANPQLRFERNSDGSLLTMAPTGGVSGNRELKAGARLLNWVEDHDLYQII